MIVKNEEHLNRLSFILKKRIHERHMSYNDLSFQTGINKNWLANIIDGKIQPSQKQLKRISYILGLNFTYLNSITGPLEQTTLDSQLESPSNQAGPSY